MSNEEVRYEEVAQPAEQATRGFIAESRKFTTELAVQVSMVVLLGAGEIMLYHALGFGGPVLALSETVMAAATATPFANILRRQLMKLPILRKIAGVK